MATEHEVDRMVVRLVGDQTAYKKMIEDAAAQADANQRMIEQHTAKMSRAQSQYLQQIARETEKANAATEEATSTWDKLQISLLAVWAGFSVLKPILSWFGSAWAPIVGTVAKFAGILGLVVTGIEIAYRVLFKWKDIPGWLQPFLIQLKVILELLWFPINMLIKGFQLLWDIMKIGITTVLLPFKLAWMAIELALKAVTIVLFPILHPIKFLTNSVKLLYEAALIVPKVLEWMAVKLWDLGKAMANATVWSVKFVASLPGRIVDVATASVQKLAEWAGIAGNALRRISSPITDMMDKATNKFIAYGNAIDEVREAYKLDAEGAAVVAMTAKRTGESVEEVARAYKHNKDAFKAWKEEAGGAGLIISKEDIELAWDAKMAYARLGEAQQGFWATLGRIGTPALKELYNLMSAAVRIATKWVSENKELIGTIAKWAAALGMVATVLTTIGTGLAAITPLVGPIVAALLAGAAGLAAWDTALGKLARGEAVNFWQRFGDNVKGAYERTLAYGKRIVAFFSEVMQGVWNAILAGKPELALKIALGAMKISWQKTWNEIDLWTGKKFSAIFSNLSAGNWSSLWKAITTEIEIAFLKLEKVITPVWTTIEVAFIGMVGKIKEFWKTTIMYLAELSYKFIRGFIDNVMAPLYASISTVSGVESKAAKGTLAAMRGLEEGALGVGRIALGKSAKDTPEEALAKLVAAQSREQAALQSKAGALATNEAKSAGIGYVEGLNRQELEVEKWIAKRAGEILKKLYQETRPSAKTEQIGRDIDKFVYDTILSAMGGKGSKAFFGVTSPGELAEAERARKAAEKEKAEADRNARIDKAMETARGRAGRGISDDTATRQAEVIRTSREAVAGYERQIRDLRKEQAALAASGQAEAAAKLAARELALNKDLTAAKEAQAKAAKDSADASYESVEAAEKEANKYKSLAEGAEKVNKSFSSETRKKEIEKHIKDLWAMFNTIDPKTSKRLIDKEAFDRNLKQLQKEFDEADLSFKAEVQFHASGLEEVREGTKGFFELMAKGEEFNRLIRAGSGSAQRALEDVQADEQMAASDRRRAERMEEVNPFIGQSDIDASIAASDRQRRSRMVVDRPTYVYSDMSTSRAKFGSLGPGPGPKPEDTIVLANALANANEWLAKIFNKNFLADAQIGMGADQL